MQRPSSRRRKMGQSSDEPTEPAKVDTRRDTKHQSSKGSWPRKLFLYAAALCTVFLLLCWNHYRTSYSLSPISALSRINDGNTPEGNNNNNHLRLKNPDSARPRIELHPGDHVYRAPITQHLHWTVTADNLRPDGVLKRVYLINGLFPGPTIEGRSGDTIMVNVTNALPDELFTIHWHGLHIENSMDGAAGVTQSSIIPGSSFLYRVSIPSDQSGTFWYHAHAGLARADGLYGGFVVHEPAPKSTVRGLMSTERGSSLDPHSPYEKEALLLIGDWYHRPAPEVLAWYMRAASFGNEPVPDSLVINGIGYFNCSMAVPAGPVDCIDSPIALSHVLPTDSVYRLRVVNTGSLAGFTLAFTNHDVRVLEVDSVAVQQEERYETARSAGILYPGQRMDLFLSRSSEKKPALLRVDLDQECFKFPNPALTPSQQFFLEQQPLSADATTQVYLDERPVSALVDIQDLPSSDLVLSDIPRTPKVSITEVVYTKIEKLAIRENVPYGFFNRTSWLPQMDPPIPLIDLERDRWDKNQFGITIPAQSSAEQGETGVWVDLVVNNLDEGGHPFHLHGHHFYILAVYKAPIGWGSYNPFSNPYPPGLELEKFPETNGYDLSRAMVRDTVFIPSRAYAVLRFRADNPGIWLFHCHIMWHLASGMAMLVDIGRESPEVL